MSLTTLSQEMTTLKTNGIFNTIRNANPCAARIKNTIVSRKEKFW